MIEPYFWFPLDMTPYLDEVREAAKAIDQQARNFSTARYWTSHPNHIGLIGEKCFLVRCGIERDLRDKATGRGDGGIDAWGCDAKTTRLSEVRLLVKDYDLDKHTGEGIRYYLVYFNNAELTCRVVGYATEEELRAAPYEQFKDGSQAHVIYELDLHREIPLFLQHKPRIPEEKYHER
jgi:hypothetical protein